MTVASIEDNVNVVKELDRIAGKIQQLMESSSALSTLVLNSVVLEGDCTGYQRFIIDQLDRSAAELSEIHQAIDQLEQ